MWKLYKEQDDKTDNSRQIVLFSLHFKRNRQTNGRVMQIA